MKFHDHTATFSYQDWSVTIKRSRLGNRMDGYKYCYSFSANKLVKDNDQWRIVANVKGYGQKRNAIAAIIKFEQQPVVA